MPFFMHQTGQDPFRLVRARLSSVEHLIVMYAYNFVGEGNLVELDISQMARTLDCDRSHLSRSVKRLSSPEIDFLRVQERRPGQATIYKINPEFGWFEPDVDSIEAYIELGEPNRLDAVERWILEAHEKDLQPQ